MLVCRVCGSFSSRVIYSHPGKEKKNICGQVGVYIVFPPSKHTDSKDLEIILLQQKANTEGARGGGGKKLLKNVGLYKYKMCK